MGVTSIEWADYTFNPWIGCEKVSAGCKNCYASVDTYARVSASRGLPLWGPGSTRHRTSETNWRKPLTWNRKAWQRRTGGILANQPRVAPRRPRVFCASLSDVFEGRAALDPWRADLFDLIERCDELDWLVLTKRPENVLRMVPREWTGIAWPSHVWMLASVENQEQAERRIPSLLAIPSPVRGLSLEPLLGPVDLSRWLCAGQHPAWDALRKPAPPRMHWLIIGGESGSGARPCDVSWVRDLVQQGREAGAATFVKQLGAWPMQMAGADLPVGRGHIDGRTGRWRLEDRKGGDMAEWPEDLRVREVVPCARA